jgi:hypothetical protein
MTDSPYAWDRDLGYKPIWRVKPADRHAEVQRQLSDAALATDVTDVETGEPVVEVTWVASKFAADLQVSRYAVHGMSEPLDSNAKPALVVSEPGDPDARLRTLSLHMLGRIRPVTK